MTSKKSYPKSVSILIALGVITVAGFLLVIITLAPSLKALSPMWSGANDGYVDDYEGRRMPSESMAPTFQIGDRILVNKKIYQTTAPQRGDIILFNPVEKLQEQGYDLPFVKRIIGLPGETIVIKDGQVYINDQPLVEDYIIDPAAYIHESDQIPEGSYFVLGDSRNNSHDSHYWGYVTEELIIGKVVSIYFPPSRVRELN